MSDQLPTQPRRWWRYALAWVAAAAAAVAVGVVAVTSVGASVRDRSPIDTGIQATASAEQSSSPSPGATSVRQTFSGNYGSLVVECRGAVGYGRSAAPASGWRTVVSESGPDDDISAVFRSTTQSVELEIYCNQGRPTLGDREVKTLGDDE